VQRQLRKLVRPHQVTSLLSALAALTGSMVSASANTVT